MALPIFSSDPTQEQSFLKRFQALAARRRERGALEVGEGRAESLRRGLTGDPYEAAAVGAARSGVERDISDIEAGLSEESARTELENRRISEARAFQSGEAEKARVFGAGEAEKARLFGAGEDEKSRRFSELMLARQQGFQGTQAEYDRAVNADIERRAAREGRVADYVGAGSNVLSAALLSKGGMAAIEKGLGALGPWGLAAGAGLALAKPISRGVKKLVKKICFLGDTFIEMEDGSVRAICMLTLGDRTRGGTVLSVRMSYGSDIYDYCGVKVTGDHAVLEDGKWTRVKNSKKAVPMADIQQVLTYSIVTTAHRVYANGIEFADEFESDDFYDVTADQSLALLNAGQINKGRDYATVG